MPRVSRRADVRSTAARLFREHGYSSATMDLIADTVGLNKGTLYHYYSSKSAILYELLSDQLDTTITLLGKVPDEGTPTERFRELVRLEVAQAAGASDELVVFFQELPWVERNLPAEQASDVLRRVEKYRNFSQKLLKEGIAAGEFRPVNVSVVHYSIVGVLAYIPNWFRPRSGRGKNAVVEELTEFVLAGILKPQD
ncbi:TetR/AcrR family transcriptional regulator [Mumia sp. DW29H23]|uniref:TetR/AcrR family transcriptional regulator n=1 Tax=Mumia sp. DW29H23 TaxID=3421241 RepID=UPI003D6897E0